jgi:CubicO group peptidase (beta-lactamase class C family)
VRARLTEADLVDPERIAALLADQEPESDPRGALMYHALTFGWLCGELVRRVDGRTIGRFFAEEVATPLRLELWIGLPAEEEHLVTKLQYGSKWGLSPGASPQPKAQDALLASIYDNPPIFPIDDVPWNTRTFHAAEIPGGGAIGTARASRASMAASPAAGRSTMYAPCAADDRGGAHATRAWCRSLRRRSDRLRRRLSAADRQPPPEPPARAFGHDGAGGSVHAAWPSHRAGVSYAMNVMRDDPQATHGRGRS